MSLMAIVMTMGVMAQCPHTKEVCPAKTKCEQTKCEQQKRVCVYSAETRAMMQVDRIAFVVKDLTDSERQQLLDFYKTQFAKCNKENEGCCKASREECKKACDAELRRVLGDERYIKYLESSPMRDFKHCDRDCGEKRCTKPHKGGGCYSK